MENENPTPSAWPLSYEVTAERVLYELQTYAFNGREICRMLNGLEAFIFKGCYHSFDPQNPNNRRGPTCRFKERGCKVQPSTVYRRLNKMQKRGLVKSTKLKLWIDGKDTGAAEYFATDTFRMFYTDSANLATRLIHDIITNVGDPAYI